MKTLKVNLFDVGKKEIDLIVDFLKLGRVIVYPTDTIYGLGCLATSVKAIKKINKIKQQKANKPMLVLASSLKMVKEYCYANAKQVEFLKTKWPGRMTVILRSRKNLPPQLISKTGQADGVAVRLPKNEFLIKIISRARAPIVSTSANIHGRKNLTKVINLENYFKIKPDLVIDAGVRKGKPSKIVDIRDVKKIKIIR